MTTYVYSGSAFTLQMELTSPADVSSVVWSLLDNAGAAISSATDVATDNAAGALAVSIATTPVQNTLVGTVTENRFMKLAWLSGGGAQSLMVPYTVRPFIPLQVQPADVIGIMGMNSIELVEADVDVQEAAMLVRDDIGATAFTAALTAGDVATNRCNQLVALRAAIELTPSIELRVAQIMKTDTSSFQRYVGFNAAKFIAGLWELYARVRADLTNEVVVQPLLFVGSVRARDKFLPLYALGYNNTGNVTQCPTYPEWWDFSLLV